MTVRRWLVVVSVGLASPAYADPSPFVGMGAISVRTSSTGMPMYDMVYDDTSRVRFAAEGGAGIRVGRVVVLAHVGIATGLEFGSSPLADSGEQVADTDTTIYPLDLGVGAHVDLSHRYWLSGWAGATIAFAFATSPAKHINAIDYTGDIPAASYSQRSLGLGVGAAVGYDVAIHQPGSFAPFVSFERQDIGTIPVRDNRGSFGYEPQSLTTLSFSLGLAYRY